MIAVSYSTVTRFQRLPAPDHYIEAQPKVPAPPSRQEIASTWVECPCMPLFRLLANYDPISASSFERDYLNVSVADVLQPTAKFRRCVIPATYGFN